MSTHTSWEHSSRDGLLTATIHLEDGDGRDMAVVLHEVAHVILRAQPRGQHAAHHGPRFIAVEDALLDAFDVPLGWDRRTGTAL